jgi:hypothetical protein
MTADLRFQLIRRTVAEVVANEGDVAGRLERAQLLSAGHFDSLAAIERLQQMVQTHRDELAAYLKESDLGEPSGEITSPLSASRQSNALAEALRDLSLAFHNCALGYAMLFEVALRLYEPRLREIAPEASERACRRCTIHGAAVARGCGSAARPGRASLRMSLPHVRSRCLRLRGLWHPNTDQGLARCGCISAWSSLAF